MNFKWLSHPNSQKNIIALCKQARDSVYSPVLLANCLWKAEEFNFKRFYFARDYERNNRIWFKASTFNRYVIIFTLLFLAYKMYTLVRNLSVYSHSIKETYISCAKKYLFPSFGSIIYVLSNYSGESNDQRNRKRHDLRHCTVYIAVLNKYKHINLSLGIAYTINSAQSK